MDALMFQRLAVMVTDALGSSDIEYVRRTLNNLDEMVDEVHKAAHAVDSHMDRLKRTNPPLFGAP